MAESDQPLNPWLWIWIRPRAVLRQILDTDPTRFVLPIAMIVGFVEVLDGASAGSLGDRVSLTTIFLIALIGGPIGGLLSVYLYGWLVGVTGRWFGGSGQTADLRAAIAWGSVPGLWLALLWIPQLALFGKEMFTEETPKLDEASPALASVFMGLAALELVGAVWSLVVLCKTVAEAHRFSAWLGLAAMFVAGLMILLPIAGVALVLGIFAGAFA
jgi:hypothetical protein